ncbi:MAG: SDR family oxidoreductase [Chloroflexi bacterium]|nr:SDR family oxidoreductase [Chloroflexota bacterium]MCI0646032.1 SDR family oxidoreductase [Chloroflexota bacterium]MCI0727374.1 SDR family oxidoreductase [Chloroflexota bacterium]
MKLLILGGTLFVGRSLVEAALARGHEVTLFNRGQHNPELFPQVEKLRGNRDGDLEALKGRQWDAAVDTCGYVPRIVRASAELLAGAVNHYTFISTISVYADFSRPGINEDDPVGKLEDESVEEVNGETYGPLKALCEQAAEAAMPGRVLTVRPGLIVGPHDPTDRFTYWPWRVAQGGQVLAPGRPDHQAQIIDVRDLAEWNLRLIEAGQTGLYNATGPDYPLTLGQVLDTSRQVSQSDATFTWVDETFLLAAGVQPWIELPLWLPGEEYAGLHHVEVGKAVAAGLTFRPLPDTVRDTLAWAQTRPADHQWRAGLPPEREQELLK